MKIAIDINRYTDFMRREARSVEVLGHADQIFLPFVVLGELRAGFLLGTRSQQNEARLIAFLNSPRVEVLFPDEGTTHHYARLFLQLRKQGTPIPTNDLWLAALAMEHDLYLFARDAHFDHLPQVPRVS
jgi:tRNA(fMet)-specific endonuclease VapC